MVKSFHFHTETFPPRPLSILFKAPVALGSISWLGVSVKAAFGGVSHIPQCPRAYLPLHLSESCHRSQCWYITNSRWSVGWSTWPEADGQGARGTTRMFLNTSCATLSGRGFSQNPILTSADSLKRASLTLKYAHWLHSSVLSAHALMKCQTHHQLLHAAGPQEVLLDFTW